MDISAFLERCGRYCVARQISRSRLSTLIFNDGKRLDAIATGGDVGVRTLGRVAARLAALEAALAGATAEGGSGS